MNGRKIESTIDRWLEATLAPPVRGMCPSPVTRGRHSRCRNGPATTLETWYFTRFLHQSGPVPITITGVRGIPSHGNGRITARPRRGSWLRADVLAGGPGG